MAGQPAGAAGKAARRFQALLDRIALQRALLAQWERFADAYQARCLRDLVPLQARHRDARIAVVQALDRAARHADLSTVQRGMVRDILLGYLDSLLRESRSPELLALFLHHAQQDYETVLADRIAYLRRMAQHRTGVDLRDLPPMESVEACAEAIEARLRAAGQKPAKATDDEAAADGDNVGPDYTAPDNVDSHATHPHDRRARKRAARAARRQQAADSATSPQAAGAPAQDAPEIDSGHAGRHARAGGTSQLTQALLRRQAEEAAVLALRALYRKLAFALHPDRERDPQEQARKTRWLQQANAAYAQRDLPALLAIQAELSADQRARLGGNVSLLDGLPPERMTALLVVLEDQAERLRAAVASAMAPFEGMASVRQRGKLTPEAVQASLDENLQHLRESIRVLQAEARRLADLDDLQRRLKQHRKQWRGRSEWSSLDDLDDLVAGWQT